MKRDSLDLYDIKPEEMVAYLRYNGMHFNHKLCDFAVSKMKKKINGKEEVIVPLSKTLVDSILTRYKVSLENNLLYDYIYVANMCKADFMGSSIKTEEQMALYIKDVIDDSDAYDGLVFNRWYADMCRKGIAINWEDMI